MISSLIVSSEFICRNSCSIVLVIFFTIPIFNTSLISIRMTANVNMEIIMCSNIPTFPLQIGAYYSDSRLASGLDSDDFTVGNDIRTTMSFA